MHIKEFFKITGQRLVALKPTKRKLIQLYAALLTNANIKGLVTGQIYKGPLKNLCSPGLNCYSCPGASGACPLGALQNSLASSGARVPYYVFGIILLYGILLGRWICGFLCPFGLIQELLHKIKTPKIKKSSVTRVLSYLKYVILALFTIALPLIYALRDFPLPGFCKYICPAGTLEGAIGLLSNSANTALLPMLGPLFTWKFAVLVAIVVGSIFMYRFFCRFLCPLGALYGLFNKISLIGIKLDKPKCTDCGMCQAKCKMDIRHVGDTECISCGECISSCPTGAIRWKGDRFVLPPNEIGGKPIPEETEKKYAKRRRVLKIVAGVTMTCVLLGALVYFNFIYKEEIPLPPSQEEVETEESEGTNAPEQSQPEQSQPEQSQPEQPLPDRGNTVGSLCYSTKLNLIDGSGLTGKTFSVDQNRGKVTVINFWGTWCSPCVAELPHFDDVARDYADQVSVVAVHTAYGNDQAAAYISKNFASSSMLFAMDGENEAYYKTLGGLSTWPMTVVVDANGIITSVFMSDITHEELVAAVEDALEH